MGMASFFWSTSAHLDAFVLAGLHTPCSLHVPGGKIKQSNKKFKLSILFRNVSFLLLLPSRAKWVLFLTLYFKLQEQFLFSV